MLKMAGKDLNEPRIPTTEKAFRVKLAKMTAKTRIAISFRGLEIVRGERVYYQTDTERIAVRNDEGKIVVVDISNYTYDVEELCA